MKAFLPVSSLLVSVGLLLMGHGLLGTLLPLRGLFEGFTSFELGILGTFYFVGFGLGTVIGPHAIGRVGHIRTFAAMVAVISIAVLTQSLHDAPIY